MAQAAVELFTNNTYATVTTGGTTAPAGGTVESWTGNVTGAFPVASTSAGPPTLFHAADPAAPSEKFLVTVAPGGTGGAQSWTVTRGAEGTTPVAHRAGFVIVQATCAGILAYLTQGASASVYVNCDYTGGTDASAAFNAALAHLPTVSGLQCGEIRVGPGKAKMAAPPARPRRAVYIEGAGNWATTIYSYVTGDCFRVYDSTTYSSRTQFGGGVKALRIHRKKA